MEIKEKVQLIKKEVLEKLKEDSHNIFNNILE